MEREAVEALSMSISDFCRAHGISRSHYFNLKKDGRGPREMRVGTRVLISREAAADWRAKCEADSADA